MFQFIKNAFKELEHVVWPTKKETRTYMFYTVSVIVVMTIFLSILGYVFRTGLKEAKYIVNPNAKNAIIEQQKNLEEEQNKALEDVYKEHGISTEQPTTSTGVTVEVSTGAVNTGTGS